MPGSNAGLGFWVLIRGKSRKSSWTLLQQQHFKFLDLPPPCFHRNLPSRSLLSECMTTLGMWHFVAIKLSPIMFLIRKKSSGKTNSKWIFIYKTGPKQQGSPAMEFVLKLYMAANPDPDRSCYSHFTTATGLCEILEPISCTCQQRFC